MGRPREFDPDEALDRALDVFWRRGYEGTSLTDLTEAMGITRPSLYAAFGNKEDLFFKALDRYDARYMGFVADALARPTAFEVVAGLLHGYADAQSTAGRPPGCLGINAAMACSDACEPLRQELVRRRGAAEAALRQRLQQAIDAGDLRTVTSAEDLSRFLMTLVHGMAVQAQAGARAEALHAIVNTYLRAWPPV